MGRLTISQIKQIHQGIDYSKAIETGTYRGEQLKTLTEVYDTVVGIELNAHYAQVSRNTAPKANVITGNTLTWLPFFCSAWKEPVVFYLDAHYCKVNPPIPKSEFPLWDELQMIAKRPYADIVIVDDVHTFGKVRDDLKFKPDAKEWESVTPENVMEYFPKCKSKIIDDSFVIWKR